MPSYKITVKDAQNIEKTIIVVEELAQKTSTQILKIARDAAIATGVQQAVTSAWSYVSHQLHTPPPKKS